MNDLLWFLAMYWWAVSYLCIAGTAYLFGGWRMALAVFTFGLISCFYDYQKTSDNNRSRF